MSLISYFCVLFFIVALKQPVISFPTSGQPLPAAASAAASKQGIHYQRIVEETSVLSTMDSTQSKSNDITVIERTALHYGLAGAGIGTNESSCASSASASLKRVNKTRRFVGTAQQHPLTVDSSGGGAGATSSSSNRVSASSAYQSEANSFVLPLHSSNNSNINNNSEHPQMYTYTFFCLPFCPRSRWY